MLNILAKLVSKLRKTIGYLGQALTHHLYRRAADRAAVRRQQRHDGVVDRLAAKPPMVREVFLLRVIEGRPMDEIADRLAISRGDAKKYLARAIRALMR
jgi:DNA-directed RNA polymerase specialized sigma24 family protein